MRRNWSLVEWFLMGALVLFMLCCIEPVQKPPAQAISLPYDMRPGPRPTDFVVAQADQPKLRETDWSKRIAADFRAQGTPAETEFVCPDGSRVDVLTPEFAYEVEWASKWKESIGQAVFYGIATNRQPGVILLMDKEQTEYLRCAVVCGKLGIRLETRSVK